MEAGVIGNIVNEEALAEFAGKFAEDNPDLLAAAKHSGKDMVVRMYNNKKVVLMVGAGVAVMAGVAGILLYRYKKRDRQE